MHGLLADGERSSISLLLSAVFERLCLRLEFWRRFVAFQWFLIEFSVRPCMSLAISAHLFPILVCASTRRLSSSSLQLSFYKTKTTNIYIYPKFSRNFCKNTDLYENLDIRTEMIVPSLTTLLACSSLKLLRDYCPFPLSMLHHQLYQLPIHIYIIYKCKYRIIA